MSTRDQTSDLTHVNIVEKLNMIETCLVYLERINKNRFLIESLYLENNFGGARNALAELMNGVAYLEYAVVILGINMNADLKNRLFEGVSEAIPLNDWLTIVDFLSTPLVQYTELMKNAFTEKYYELERG